MKWHKWAKSKHLEEVARAEFPDCVYLETRTIDTLITIGYAAATTASAPVESEVAQRYKVIEQVSRARLRRRGDAHRGEDRHDLHVA